MKKKLMLGMLIGLGFSSLNAGLFFRKIENKTDKDMMFTGKLPGGWGQPSPRFPFYIHPKSVGFDITIYGKQTIDNKMQFSNLAIPPKGSYLQIKIGNNVYKIWDENWEVHLTKNGKKYKTAPFQANDKYFEIIVHPNGEMFLFAVKTSFGLH